MAKGFLKNVRAELKKVVWPTKKQLIKNTIMVVILVLAVAAIVLTFDMIVEKLDVVFWNFITSKIA